MKIEHFWKDVEGDLRERAQSPSRYYARVAQLLLDLFSAIRREPDDSRLYASLMYREEIWLQYKASSGAFCLITVTMDRRDYGPVENGLPIFHYRMSYRISGPDDERESPMIETRAHSTDLAMEFVRTAITETRNTR